MLVLCIIPHPLIEASDPSLPNERSLDGDVDAVENRFAVHGRDGYSRLTLTRALLESSVSTAVPD
ncbi:MAG: hypothetical protein OXC91_01405 [Rhodobacteraceae bacterium]|nr:hypothetical protein [Paracoccaceae bacterium]